MIGRITYMELRTGLKGLLIFCLLITVVATAMPLIFPAYRDSLTEELEGANNVNLELPTEEGDMITLSWEPLEMATGYMVLEDNRSSMVTAKIKYVGTETRITFEKDFEERRYYAVLAETAETVDMVLIGVASTEKGDDPFQDLINNPAYAGLTGGRNISILEPKGFIALEFFSWWWMLAGLFIAYQSVSVIAGDFENKRMDVMLSTPISRRRYLLEKFGAMSIIALLIILVATGGLIAGIANIDALNEFGAETVFLSLVGCLPFLMAVSAVGIFTAVFFQKTRVGMGVSFAFVIGEFFIYTFGNFSKSLEWMKSVSIFNYWDYSSVIFDNMFEVGDFVLLAAVAIAIVIISIWVFEKKDIPT